MVGKNIKHFREKKGFTQEQLADQLHVTRQAVSNWENEKTQPDVETLHQISCVLECSVEELIYGTERAPAVVNHTTVQHVTKNVTKGLSFGAALAMVISYVEWHSIGWAIFHGMLNWVYVIYYLIRYVW